MKNITLFLLTLLLFISCNNDNHFSGYYEEDYIEEDTVKTVKVEQPQPIIYYYDHVNNIFKDTIITIKRYNDGFSINDIRYKAEKVIEWEHGLSFLNVTSEETGEYYYRVYIDTNTWIDKWIMFIRFYENLTTIKGDLYGELWRY